MTGFRVKMIYHMGNSASTGEVRRIGRFPFSRLALCRRYRFGGDSRHDGL